jgi:hypothetical protein
MLNVREVEQHQYLRLLKVHQRLVVVVPFVLVACAERQVQEDCQGMGWYLVDHSRMLV